MPTSIDNVNFGEFSTVITLRHSQSARLKKCPIGFSLTTFFFGLLVPLVRGDLKWAAIIFALGTIFGVPSFGFGVLGVHTVFAFYYNKIYIRNLLERGFVPADHHSKAWCVANGLLAENLFTSNI